MAKFDLAVNFAKPEGLSGYVEIFHWLFGPPALPTCALTRGLVVFSGARRTSFERSQFDTALSTKNMNKQPSRAQAQGLHVTLGTSRSNFRLADAEDP
jgi:hypothetical protein